MFSDLAKAIIFMILFTPLGLLSVKTTKFIPHLGVETVTSCSFFMGYLFGWPVGLFFGVIIGGYIWSVAAGLSQFVMANLFLNGLVAFLGHFFNVTLHWKFALAYTVGMITRNILSYLIVIPLGANPVENVNHFIADMAWNVIVFAQFMFILYRIAVLV
jgi:hypothetical protein